MKPNTVVVILPRRVANDLATAAAAATHLDPEDVGLRNQASLDRLDAAYAAIKEGLGR